LYADDQLQPKLPPLVRVVDLNIGESTQHKRAGQNRQDSWKQIAAYFSPPKQWKNEYGDYRSPLRFADGGMVRTANDWKKRRAEILKQWNDLLGHWPPLITEPKVEVLESQHRENFRQLRIRFKWTPNEYTTGYLLIPDGDTPRPGIVTVYYEPETGIGLGKPYRDFAYQLARRGFVALSLGTTEATAAKTYALYHPDLDNARVQPLSMLACAAANAWYVLAARPEVDSKRIGIVGHSFGGKWAMFASCLFDKYACAVWSDPGIVFDESRGSVNYWEPWYLGYHPRPWRKRGRITEDNPRLKGISIPPSNESWQHSLVAAWGNSQKINHWDLVRISLTQPPVIGSLWVLPHESVINCFVAFEDLAMHFTLIIVPDLGSRFRKDCFDRQ
ncbi:MAG: dienelactone hydrolase family protein, partial [Proteobacteria bacterium]|nr:dienelactone hydrolase family protein [Pseudomonadota bacterium]